MIRELHHRLSDGIEVKLLWNSETDRVSVVVLETHRGALFAFEVAADEALDAFHHPYAYARHEHHDDALAA